MLVLNVTYDVKPGLRDEFYAKVKELGVPEGSRAEAGNRKYEYFFAVDNVDRIFLLEHWQDQAAFDLHIQMDYFIKLQEIKNEYVANTTIERYEI
ncbi:MAG: putative quinol monooxygenase [Anaerovoracaceae bacterium]